MTRPGGLRYYPDSRPGIRRERRGRGFSYIAPDGTRLAGRERARIEALAIPPAYEKVWIAPFPDAHLLATGYDARGRKQYRYHPLWSEAQAETKFASLVAFGAALPAIRRRVRRDLALEPGEERFALAAAVALIDRLSLRVGGALYARENGSYGALTLKRRHVRFRDGNIHLSFKAKGGTRVRRQLADSTLMRALERICDLPGAELLSWTDDDGEAHGVGSTALNAYLCEAGGEDGFSAKTFRTWAGTVAAFAVATESDKPTIRDMAAAAAARLHNTPAIARKSYIHPDVIALANVRADLPPPAPIAGLTIVERRLLAYLESTGGRGERPRPGSRSARPGDIGAARAP